MATITQKNHNARNNVGATPWGNAHGLHYTLQTAANGSVVGGDSAAAVASGDKVRIGVIPGGSNLLDLPDPDHGRRQQRQSLAH